MSFINTNWSYFFSLFLCGFVQWFIFQLHHLKPLLIIIYYLGKKWFVALCCYCYRLLFYAFSLVASGVFV